MALAGVPISRADLPMHFSDPSSIRTGLYATLGALFLGTVVGCGSTSPVSTRTPADSATVAYLTDDLTAEDVRDRLVFEVNRWLGVRYQYGGAGRSGFDCSGFVRRVYRDALDRSLPRTTRDQMRVGGAVARNRLQVGDLVFFRTPARTDHVGVYIGDGEFAHASSSSGVMVSHLGEPYWSKSYRSARRVLDLNDGDWHPKEDVGTVGAEPNERAEDTDVPASRPGW